MKFASDCMKGIVSTIYANWVRISQMRHVDSREQPVRVFSAVNSYSIQHANLIWVISEDATVI
jgi:hypothetical protein